VFADRFTVDSNKIRIGQIGTPVYPCHSMEYRVELPMRDHLWQRDAVEVSASILSCVGINRRVYG
jgi:hypothetical protein